MAPAVIRASPASTNGSRMMVARVSGCSQIAKGTSRASIAPRVTTWLSMVESGTIARSKATFFTRAAFAASRLEVPVCRPPAKKSQRERPVSR